MKIFQCFFPRELDRNLKDARLAMEVGVLGMVKPPRVRLRSLFGDSEVSDRAGEAGGGGMGLEKARELRGLSAFSRLVQLCNLRFWRSPDGVLPILERFRLDVEAVSGEIMLDTALVSLLVVGVRLKLKAFLTLCRERPAYVLLPTDRSLAESFKSLAFMVTM